MTEQPTGERIVVGMDGSAAAAAAVTWAAGQASTRGAVLRVVNAWLHDGMLDDASVNRTTAQARDVHLKELEATTSKLIEGRTGLKVEYSAPIGDPGEVLVEEAKDASMLVLGSHGNGKLRNLFVGSVCNACLRHSTCPVVVIPPPAREPGSRLGRLLTSVAYEPGPIL